ncbi:class II glutamine amidotransferase [Polyangium mundeleinium]|uniref:Class II glutamine amidotransferase n=1 Tax=Polyangium mundeleinium TaxID=2995306 RepID=A0ABT5F5P4_9BACT|nr:class II glutamine amidotransferase [Polyangium mundeleinium]MDC0749421.1 class II glutamine amidotransferase [Polyangium mundeleinium]
MCELLGMECNVPTDIVFSFSGLCQRGGKTGPHGDGWGLSFYEGYAARVFLEPTSAAASPLARFLAQNPIKTMLAIGHVRKRTRGPTSLANTHPFVRELWGRHWVFAHNGTLPRVRQRKLGRFTPIGTTDSEYAFCVLLEELRRTFDDYPRRPSELWQTVADAGARIAKDGTFNFLLGDGRHLFARCGTRLCYIIRKAPFGLAHLADEDLAVDFSAVTTPRDRVAVVATAPLTKNETWTQGKPGEMWVFDHGRLLATLPSGTPDRRPARAERELRASAARDLTA